MSIFKSIDHVTSDLARLRHIFVNLYFLGPAESWVLVDAGLKGAAMPIIKAAEHRYGKGTKPKAIILTHGHFDHVGAFPEIFHYWDVPVYAHSLEIPYLTGLADYPPPDPLVGKGMMAWLSFLYPRKAIDLGNRVRILPEDGSVPFMPEWRWIHTPGHAPGHVSLFRERDRCLIAGDAFVTTKQESFFSVVTQERGVYGPPAYFTPDWQAAHASVEKLAALKPAIAATGHGQPLRANELTQGLQELAQHFDTLALPKHGRYVQKTTASADRSIEAEEADWLQQRTDRSNPSIGSPDPSAAPLGTDQEAGGAITTPSGRRKYSKPGDGISTGN